MMHALSKKICYLLSFSALLVASSVFAHDSINAEGRKNYVTKLQEWHATLSSTAPAAVRAKAQYQIAVMLDEIRDLFNQDVISHGKIKGLETSTLLNELARGEDKLELSTKTGLYIAHLQPYREAIRLDPKAAFLDHARYMLLKSQFYDSFSDDPLKPIAQSKEELTEMIVIGEALLKSKDALVNMEEVRFILAVHYIQAMVQKSLPKEETQKKIIKLLQDLRKDSPNSLKIPTIEALQQQ
jgi:hypothetical protein